MSVKTPSRLRASAKEGRVVGELNMATLSAMILLPLLQRQLVSIQPVITCCHNSSSLGHPHFFASTDAIDATDATSKVCQDAVPLKDAASLVSS